MEPTLSFPSPFKNGGYPSAEVETGGSKGKISEARGPERNVKSKRAVRERKKKRDRAHRMSILHVLRNVGDATKLQNIAAEHQRQQCKFPTAILSPVRTSARTTNIEIDDLRFPTPPPALNFLSPERRGITRQSPRPAKLVHVRNQERNERLEKRLNRLRAAGAGLTRPSKLLSTDIQKDIQEDHAEVTISGAASWDHMHNMPLSQSPRRKRKWIMQCKRQAKLFKEKRREKRLRDLLKSGKLEVPKDLEEHFTVTRELSVREAAEAELIGEAVMEAMRSNLSRIVDLLRAIDKDQSGSVDEDEFIEGIVHMNLDGIGAREASLLFRAVDTDGSGEIEYAELKNAFRERDTGMTAFQRRVAKAHEDDHLMDSLADKCHLSKRDKRIVWTSLRQLINRCSSATNRSKMHFDRCLRALLEIDHSTHSGGLMSKKQLTAALQTRFQMEFASNQLLFLYSMLQFERKDWISFDDLSSALRRKSLRKAIIHYEEEEKAHFSWPPKKEKLARKLKRKLKQQNMTKKELADWRAERRQRKIEQNATYGKRGAARMKCFGCGFMVCRCPDPALMQIDKSAGWGRLHCSVCHSPGGECTCKVDPIHTVPSSEYNTFMVLHAQRYR